MIKMRMEFIFMAVLLVFASGCQVFDDVNSEKSSKIEEETWDLLWISDSSGWNVADIYGEFIAEDNQVEVRVNDMWKGGLSAGRILQGLTDQGTYDYDLDHLREYITESEVIVIYGNPEDSVDPSNPMAWNCGQSDLEDCYVTDCSPETFSTYVNDLKAIYAKIFEIRKGKPTIIRAIDAYNPRLVSHCQLDGVLDACVTCWETYNEAIQQAADEMGVPVARVFDAWNGMDHRENPVEKGYTQADNVHPNQAGAEVIAQLLRDLGYEAMVP